MQAHARPARRAAHRRQGQHVHRGRPHHLRLEDPRELPAGLHGDRRAPGVGRPWSCSARPTWTSSRWARRTRTPPTAPTRNPWDLATRARRLSGGSAAAVAAGVAPWALGTDTGGSIRQPAALCGIVGLKPTYGAVSRYGMIAFASSLDQSGPLTRTVADCALLLQHIAGHDPRDSTSVELPEPVALPTAERLDGLRVGVPAEYLGEAGSSPACARASTRRSRASRSSAATCVEISLPHAEHGLPAYYVIAPAEASANLARFDGVRYGSAAPTAATCSTCTSARAARASAPRSSAASCSAPTRSRPGYYDAYYGRAQKVRTLIAPRLRPRPSSGVDLIVTPTSPTVAFEARRADRRPARDVPVATSARSRSTSPASRRSRSPAASRDGLPVGLQIARPGLQREPHARRRARARGGDRVRAAPTFATPAPRADG